MSRERSQTETERLFVDAAEGTLAEAEANQWQAALAADPELRAKFEQYQRALSLLHQLPREKAPEGLGALILRRTRRKRFQISTKATQSGYLPAEVVIPIVLAALAALYLLFSP